MGTLYENIRARRIALGLSQEELAKKMGYTSRSTIAKIESGENDITQSKIEYFAKALETTPAWLMGWETSETPTPTPNKDAEVQELLEYYRTRPEMKMLFSVTKNASPESIRRAAAIVEALEKEERGGE